MAKPIDTGTTGAADGAGTTTGKKSDGATGNTRKEAPKRGTAKGGTAKGGTAKRGTAKSGAAKSGAAKSGSVTAGAAAGTAARTRKTRPAEEVERIRTALRERQSELRDEYEQHVTEITELQRDRLTDSAGDDQADTGSKTFEREQEISLANSILERITQVERALERLDDGSYGWCERCGDAIPVERLAAFPSATLCVKCKQLEERR